MLSSRIHNIPALWFALAILVISVFNGGHTSAQAQDNNDFGDIVPIERPNATARQTDQTFQRDDVEPPMPQVLRNHVNRGAQAKYLGFFNGLHGWVLIKGGKPEFHYVTADGNAIVMGILFDKDGNMITGEQLRMLRLEDGAATYKLSELAEQRRQTRAATTTPPATESAAPAPDPQAAPQSRSEQFFTDVEEGNWLRFGNPSAPILYAFIDPTCEYCRKFLRDIKTPYLDNGIVQLRVLPMGYNEDSLKKAAFLLAAPNPEDSLYSYVQGDFEALLVPGEINTEGALRNIAILNKWEISGTPVITYRDRSGIVRFVRGAPENVAVIVDELER